MAGWEEQPLDQCLDPFRVPSKIKKSQFTSVGQFPIVSQEADFISGYWNDDQDVCKLERPVVIFGDHTQVVKFIDFDFVVGADGVKILRPKLFLEPKYLYYYIQGNRAPSQGYARHYRHIKRLIVRFPPLEEQRRIVEVLDEAFEGLCRARAHAEANLHDAENLFEEGVAELFGNFVDSESWVSIGSVCRFENGDRGKNYPGRNTFVPSGIPFINAGHLENGLIDWSTMNYIPEGRYHRLSRGKTKVDDLLFCLRGSLGKFAKVEFDGMAAIASSLVIVRCGEKIIPDFLAAYFASSTCAAEIERYAGGAAQPNLSAKNLAAFRMPLPEIRFQKELVERFARLKSMCTGLNQGYFEKLSKVDRLRQSLLQRAFAGGLT